VVREITLQVHGLSFAGLELAKCLVGEGCELILGSSERLSPTVLRLQFGEQEGGDSVLLGFWKLGCSGERAFEKLSHARMVSSALVCGKSFGSDERAQRLEGRQREARAEAAEKCAPAETAGAFGGGTLPRSFAVMGNCLAHELSIQVRPIRASGQSLETRFTDSPLLFLVRPIWLVSDEAPHVN
jgi:hypothetical protein